MMGVGKVTEVWDWMRREARKRVCLVLTEVGVAGKVSMNSEFIERRKTGDKVIELRGVEIADKEIIHY